VLNCNYNNYNCSIVEIISLDILIHIMEMKDFDGFEKDVKTGDLVMLQYPNSINAPLLPIEGTDYMVGFCMNFDEEKIYLSCTQKVGYEEEMPYSILKEDIEKYSIIQRYDPFKDKDGLDKTLVEILEMEVDFDE